MPSICFATDTYGSAYHYHYHALNTRRPDINRRLTCSCNLSVLSIPVGYWSAPGEGEPHAANQGHDEAGMVSFQHTLSASPLGLSCCPVR